ncbi:putative membrane protein DUF2157 [Chitinophaga niastensis]|uniref:Putative membrane protein DUF2157 n=1 Tax=Chitinophaga niastensis TaxID=536980 RepID=A0A2P8HNI8_CHINA|nr:DUF2157 domain-containing protein [Chitinophaga niastensis]PSL47772.1 putative membrane protein DUF2157 [Chitinophaga niastensis]
MNIHLFEKLRTEGLVSDTAVQAVKTEESNRLFSLHWEIKTLLYLGVLLLSGGLGILIYKNIDTIGHQVILLFIGLLCAGCFSYCIRKKAPFSWQKVISPNAFFDYALLLGCLTFVTFIGYLQFEYTAFGKAYGLATFIPFAVLAVSAYYFDHLGVLSMAITNLAAWMGIAVTPFQVLSANDFSSDPIIYTGVLLGGILLLLAIISTRRNLKKHFTFTYQNFGTNIIFIACISALCVFGNNPMLWLLIIIMAAVSVYTFKQAFREGSFYFVLITVLYAYVGISIIVFRLLVLTNDIGAVYLGLLYVIGSAIGVILLLINLNKKIKHARI